MKTKLALIASVASLGIAGAALADTASGPGGIIPASGSGGGGVWQTTLPPSPFVSAVSVPGGVASITSVTFTALTHTWIGDLQAVLVNPSGAMFNIFVRPGSVGGSLGNSGDFILGDYTFTDVASGNPTLPTAGNASPGSYSQSFADWSNTGLVANTPFSGISFATAGTWEVRVYDWAGGDVGSTTGVTITYAPVPAPGALALLGLAGLVRSRRRRT